MTYKNDPAFPFVETNNQTENVSEGISKREYFAAAALQGLLAAKSVDVPTNAAVWAVKCADDIIKALNEEK